MTAPAEDISQSPETPVARHSSPGALGLLGSIVAGAVVIALATLLMNRISVANTQVHAVPTGATGISLVGRTAPDVAFNAWTVQPGRQVTLASLRGHPVVLNFWEATCAPCVAEAPLLAQAARAYQAHGIIFVGVALYTSQSDGAAFLKQYGLTYLAGAATTSQTVVDYSLIGVPDTYFINSAGVIVAQRVGQITQQQLTQGIAQALR